jgi:hypothetical protein
VSSRVRDLLLPPVVLAVLCLPLCSQAPQSTQGAPSDDVTLQIIVVGSPEKAHHVLDELKQGESFASLAKKESIDSTADGGGSMGKMHYRVSDLGK